MSKDVTKEVVDGFKAVADFWSAQGKAMIEAQQGAARSVVEGMQAMFGPSGTALPIADFAATPELAQAGEAMMQLWSVATRLSTELAGQLGQSSGGSDAMKDVLERITNPRQWMLGNGEIDEALARMVDGPRLADLWDVERRYGSVMRRWTELRQRSFEHQRVVLDAWIKVSQQYLTELASRNGADGKAPEPKEALALWTEIGNRHMLEAQRSEPFLKTQRDMIRASTELRIAQSELSEFIGKQYGLPTRTELDDVHRSLTEMRRELRKVRRELDQAKQAKPAPTLQPDKLPAKSRATVTRPTASRREAR
jgi:hypothetical protein